MATHQPGLGVPASRLNVSSHPRVFRANKYVYAVLSRRAGGVSVGVNLNPDKACNFGCIYCQVDRTAMGQESFVDLPRLLDELKAVLEGLRPGGPYWQQTEFQNLSPQLQVVRDVAFSGDGEPTTFRNFREVVQRTVELKETLGFTKAKVVVITNATALYSPPVRAALEFLDAHQGEVWAKLDAGTPEYFARINHTRFPYDRILENILSCARERPTVIQSCFMRVSAIAPPDSEITAYVGRLKDILTQGGRIKLVQVYSVARPPADAAVSSLSTDELESIAARVRSEAGVPATAY